MRTSAGTFAQVFWADAPAFTEERSVRLPLKSPGSFQRLYFPLPADGVSWLRFDPMDAPGEALIRHIRLSTPGGNPWPPSVSNSSGRPSRSRRSRATAMRRAFRPRLAAAIPRCIFSIGCIDSRSGLAPAHHGDHGRCDARQRWRSSALLIASVVVIGRAAFAVEPGNELASEFTSTAGPRRALAGRAVPGRVHGQAAASCIIPVKVPFWDQWDAEAGAVLIPFNECGLSWRAMFTPHNEHRVFFTRLYALDVVLANGQWDPRVQQVCNAAMHSFTAVLRGHDFLAGEQSAASGSHRVACAPSRSRCRSPGRTRFFAFQSPVLFPGALFNPGVVAHDQVSRPAASAGFLAGLGGGRRCSRPRAASSFPWPS